MGFGFSLAFILFVLPATLILLLLIVFTKKRRVFGVVLLLLWSGVFGIISLSLLVQWYHKVPDLSKDDYTGSYVIDTSFFPGVQSRWQYHHYRFRISHNDSLYLTVADSQAVRNVYKVGISYKDSYASARLDLNSDSTSHHILKSDPTTYRSRDGFYLVFTSEVYGNMFFRKGTYK